jgi:hypothetical protein
MRRQRFLSAAVITLAASSSFGYSLVDRQYNFSYYFESFSQSGAAFVQGQSAGVGANSSWEQFWDDSGDIACDYIADFDLSVSVKYSLSEAPPQSIVVTHSRTTSRVASVSSALVWGEPMGGVPRDWSSDASGGTAKSTLEVLIGSININTESETIGTVDESGMNGRGSSQSVSGTGMINVAAQLGKDGGTTSVYENGKWYLKQKYKFKSKVKLGEMTATANTTLFLPWCNFDISSGASFQITAGLISTWTESALN